MVTWTQLCERTAQQIVELGFEIEYLREAATIEIGAELCTGVHLLVSAGDKSVSGVNHTTAGISEGLLDMASDGLSGRMILYGLEFRFVPTGTK
ncbi:hypothetical protein F5X96DRAFT_670502 [Biscogniauxia mediterranea]|nr:hypothetical protein F5X96DRAFT_670502 [Biscogniauxia mediterranea]